VTAYAAQRLARPLGSTSHEEDRAADRVTDRAVDWAASRGRSGSGLGGGSHSQLGNPVARGVSQGDRRQYTLLWQVARREVDSKVVV
jgi:hypothetical protein